MKRSLLGIFRKLAIALSALLPRSLQLSIYRFSFFLFKFLLIGEKGRLWYRNSLYFEDIVFGVSDIDMTFLQDENESYIQVRRIEKKLRLIKCLFPHLGEINYYSKNLLKDFLPLANPIELKRDPIFLAEIERIGASSFLPKLEKSDIQAFVLNWVASDAHRMRENFSFRKSKIKRFLFLLDSEEKGVRNLEELISSLSTDYFQEVADIQSFLTDFTYFDFSHQESFNSFYEEYPEWRVYFMCLFPQKWIGASLHHQKFQDDLYEISKASKELKDIFLKQLRWESWGLLGQWLRVGDDINFHIHVENLLRVARSVTEDGTLEITGLTNLSRLHEGKLYDEEHHAC